MQLQAKRRAIYTCSGTRLHGAPEANLIRHPKKHAFLAVTMILDYRLISTSLPVTTVGNMKKSLFSKFQVSILKIEAVD